MHFWATAQFILFLYPARSFQYFLCVVYHCSAFAEEKGTSEHESYHPLDQSQILCHFIYLKKTFNFYFMLCLCIDSLYPTWNKSEIQINYVFFKFMFYHFWNHGALSFNAFGNLRHGGNHIWNYSRLLTHIHSIQGPGGVQSWQWGQRDWRGDSQEQTWIPLCLGEQGGVGGPGQFLQSLTSVKINAPLAHIRFTLSPFFLLFPYALKVFSWPQKVHPLAHWGTHNCRESQTILSKYSHLHVTILIFIYRSKIIKACDTASVPGLREWVQVAASGHHFFEDCVPKRLAWWMSSLQQPCSIVALTCQKQLSEVKWEEHLGAEWNSSYSLA